MNEQTTTGYSTPAYGAGWYPPAQRTSTQSIVVLILGVASLTVVWGIAGIVALFLAPGAKREIADSHGALGGSGLVKAGVICSWVSLALTLLAVLLFAALFLAVGIGGAGFDTSVTVDPSPYSLVP